MTRDANIARNKLPGSQIIGCFGFSRYTDFTMHLGMIYIKMHSKNYASRKNKMNEGSIY